MEAKEVPAQPIETPTMTKLDVHQSSSGRKTSKRFVEKEKGKKIMQSLKFQPRKPQTWASNKLILNSKVVSGPSLKGSMIVLNETPLKPTQKSMVSSSMIEHKTKKMRE